MTTPNAGRSRSRRGIWSACCVLGALTFAGVALAQTPHTPQELVTAMMAREKAASAQRTRFEYVSNERSDRTGGHLWTERVIETQAGRVRLLIAEDGKPLPPERATAERAKLADEAARPDEFIRREQTNKNDEEHARSMLTSLPNGFVLFHVRLEGNLWRLDFKPDPNYDAKGMEDKVLHSMQGTMAIDAKELRLVHIDGRLAQDVSLGFGLLANVKAGSNFATDKIEVGGVWRAVHVNTDIRGKAILFKSFSRASDWNRTDLRVVDQNLSVPQAVALLQK